MSDVSRPDDVVHDPRTLIEWRMTEKRFQAQVVDLATKRGWLIYHTYDSRRSDEGFPDLVMVRGTRLIFAELKRASGSLAADQKRWLDALMEARLAACSINDDGDESWTPFPEVYVWRPFDWDDLAEILQ